MNDQQANRDRSVKGSDERGWASWLRLKGPARGRVIFGYCLACILLLVFVASGLPKFSATGKAAANFSAWGFKGGFRLFIGAAEVILALLLLSRYAFHAAYGLAVIMVGAIIVTLDSGRSSSSAVTCLVALMLFMVVRSNQLQVRDKAGLEHDASPSERGGASTLVEGKEG